MDPRIIIQRPMVSLMKVRQMPTYLRILHQSPRHERRVVHIEVTFTRSMVKKKVRNRSETFMAFDEIMSGDGQFVNGITSEAVTQQSRLSASGLFHTK